MRQESKRFRIALLLSIAIAVSTGLLAAHASSPWPAADQAPNAPAAQPAAEGNTIFLPLITQQIPPIRIDSGASASYTDGAGNVWAADTGFIGGQTSDHGNISIGNTSDPHIYQTERYKLTGYSLAVANGSYTVKLHFMENFYTSAGKRIFNVNVEGTPINNIDVFAETGGTRIALIKTATVTVSDNQLNLGFTASSGETMIDGIEVIPQ
jgi:hypothetical protein